MGVPSLSEHPCGDSLSRRYSRDALRSVTALNEEFEIVGDVPLAPEEVEEPLLGLAGLGADAGGMAASEWSPRS